MTEDREGNLWLGTRTQGLWRVRPARVEVLTKADGLSDQVSRLVLEDHTGALWVATEAGGLDCLSGGTAKHFDVGRLRESISSLLETREGVIWTATREVFFLKGGAFTAFSSSRDGGPRRIGAMAEDDAGRIWFGGGLGLLVWDGSEPREAINRIARHHITALAVSAGSTIWAGTVSGRVFRGTGEQFDAVAAPDAFARQPISSLLPDADGSLWVGTMGGGLFHFREGRVVALAPRMSEADPRITCVLDDGAGFLWMGTRGGICRAEKAKLLDPAFAAPVPTLMLDRGDGLLTRECSNRSPAGWRGRDGTLYFG